MNKSLYIKTMEDQYQIDFQEIWRSAIGYKSAYDQERAENDSVEDAFWKTFSLKYDNLLSLVDYAPEIFDRLVAIIGVNKELIEFGCGTGKFTIPMSEHHKHITGIDFSSDMLKQLDNKISVNSIGNIDLLHGKLEEVETEQKDVVYGINANYRMLNIKDAIRKMQSLARERVVIVWTMQRNPYDAILNSTSTKGIERGQEYIQLLNVLYDMGIDPSMEMVSVVKPILVDMLSEHHNALRVIGEAYELDVDNLMKAFNEHIVEIDNQLIYQCPQKVAIIHFEGKSN